MRSDAVPGDLVTTFSGTVYDLALNPSNAELYATTDTDVFVVDTDTLTEIGRVSLGNAPRGVAVSPDGTRLYVATSAAPELVVVDVATLRAIDAIALPRFPFDVEAGRDGRVYLTPGSGGGYGGIMQVDAITGTFQQEFGSVSVYYNGLLQMGPDGRFLYFANRGLSPGTLAKFDVSSPTPVKVYQNPHGDLGSNGQDLWLTSDGAYVYYAVGGGNRSYDIARIRTFDMTIRGYLRTGPYPREITTSPDGVIAYAVHESGHIDVWDTETQIQLTSYPTSGQATELVVDRSGNHLFASFPGGLRVYEAEGSAPIVDDDADGVEDAVDNCVGLANPDQADADADGIGDVCDEFPEEANHDLAACRIERDDASASLGVCLDDLATCQAASAPEDADGDGEFDDTDECLDTPAGEPVDQAGCSREQFCSLRSGGVFACATLDWGNDEPASLLPRDCRSGGVPVSLFSILWQFNELASCSPTAP